MDRYTKESLKLSKAFDIAIECWQKYPDADNDLTKHYIDTLSQWRTSLMNPEAQYRNLTSMKYYHNNLFHFFNDEKTERVDYFWQRIKEENLDYQPIDLLDKIFKRKKIINRHEYEYSIDNIGIAQQSGRITEKQGLLLSKWISVFEEKNAEI